MKEVIAVVRMNMMNRSKAALSEAGIDAFFAHEAQGRGKGFVNVEVLEGAESGYEEAAAVLGEKGKLYPKRMLTVVVADDVVPEVVEVLTKVNQTGKPGDGKIFVLPLGDAVRVRTSESGEKAIA
nr:P-II family nitrogen regulator [uncultured Pseudodesulfovibrio sp.]